jgi:hypothetical protein
VEETKPEKQLLEHSAFVTRVEVFIGDFVERSFHISLQASGWLIDEKIN